jgi:hypothetical protein
VVTLPYEHYGIAGRPPMYKEAGIGQWFLRQGRGLKHFGKLQVQMVDPRKYKGHHFGRAREHLRTGWRSLSPASLVGEGKKFVGRGRTLTPKALSKSKEFIALQKANPSYAEKIMGSVRSATTGKKGWFYHRAPRGWLAAPSQTWGEAWRTGGRAGTGRGLPTRAGHRIRALAEEASRRGWTGASGVGKYVPWGGKGLTTGFIGYGAATGLGGKLEPGETRLGRLGAELGSNIGYVAAAPMGLMGLLGTSMLWGAGGEAAGTRISKALGKKPVPQPVYASQQPARRRPRPSPTVLYEQLTPTQRRILQQAARSTVVSGQRTGG